MTKLLRLGLTIGVAGLMVGAVGCTKKSASNSSTAASAALVYQNPTVSCTLTANGNTLMNVSNLTGAANFPAPPQAPVTVGMNCSGSTSHDNTPLTYTYSINGGAPTAFVGSKTGSDPQLTFGSHGLNSVTLVATDGLGITTTVNVSLPVSCDPSKYPALSGPTGMSVTKGQSEGYANVSFSGAASGGGGGPYQYAIDINGDGGGLGRFDYYTPQGASAPQYWSTQANWQNLYNFYSGNRSIGVQVYDTACQFMAYFPNTYNWSTGVLAGAQTGPMNQIPPTESYFYLQGNVSSTSGSTDLAEAVSPFDARDTKGGPHVVCSWADQGGSTAPTTGVFNITASNTYDDGVQNDKDQLTEKLNLSFSIPENGSLNLGPQSVNLSNASYQTSASPGGALQQYVYNMDNANGCTAYVQVQRVSSPVMCAGQSNNGYTWGNAIVQGTYSCPKLNSTSGNRTTKIQNGYFYCETGPGDNCVGGGQEGGTPTTSF